MSDQAQWLALHISGMNAGGEFDYILAYSQDIDKLRAYASQRSNKELEWRQGLIYLKSQAKINDWESYDIVPDSKVVILL